ncbi:MAG: nitrite reductase, copper-containing [Nitrospinaceae bacterium]|nr:nitrite reductase, copper-containing [Nitrospinaceae bacterium]NIR55019.1 nitrite reductase, copper-containing [Nitrospinaceae bacterium]NIS85418.1 nitrite reductase, copper-containing [Nitrospinaceae bacterium]NIT82257.1 nitrite reductase, copper-containing [Nitrospinaceae bacterium]NIU44487.1 nitrite reductase, copper-containing [Nitrospinaceae bacterium]
MYRFLLPGFLVGLLLTGGLSGCGATAGDAQAEGADKVEGKLASAPNVPPPVMRSEPKTVVLHFEAREYVDEITEDVKYHYWSFGGTVPGPMARVKVGDTVEFHLSNPASNSQDHNIDIHAVNGPGGGAAVSGVAPGESKVFTFKALSPGLFIYHCAAGAIVDHISNGMYGLILVEPEGGLPKVDREFYVMESEFFAADPVDGVAAFDINRGLAEHATYVVFNGRQNSLMGPNVLKAKAGETVRIYFGNIGPNGTSSFHVIGEIFDKVYVEGGTGLVNTGIQTTLVPSAGATIVEFKVDVPGTYTLVDHSIYRVAKGAIGQLVVEGPEKPGVYRSGE